MSEEVGRIWVVEGLVSYLKVFSCMIIVRVMRVIKVLG